MANVKTLPINGERLRAFRTNAQLSQGDLSKRSGVSRSYIAEIERNTKDPSKRVAAVLADALDIGLEALMS